MRKTLASVPAMLRYQHEQGLVDRLWRIPQLFATDYLTPNLGYSSRADDHGILGCRSMKRCS